MRDAAGQDPQRLQLARPQQFFFDLFALFDFRPQPLVGLLEFGGTLAYARGQHLIGSS